MLRKVGFVAVCFAAGLLGSMVGRDLSGPQTDRPTYSTATVAARGVARDNATGGDSMTPGSASNEVIRAVRRVGPATVNIDTVVVRKQSMFGFDDPFGDFFGNDAFTRMVPSRGQGSGLIIDSKNGYVVTNEHVVHDVTSKNGKIKVSLPNKQTFEAEVLGSDPQYDIAVLKIDGGDLPSVPLSGRDNLTIGEWVVAIGNPFGFRNTVTLGVLSALDRSLQPNEDGTRLEGLLQTDAAINPGNSGGPLCDIDGNVIGINTAIISGASGLGFAISAHSVKPVVDELIKYGKVRHGWAGMNYWDISQRIADHLGLKNTDGALVSEVYTNGPADSAGIKPADVILEAGGDKINTVADIVGLLRETRTGDTLQLTISRKGKTIKVQLKLTEAPESIQQEK